MQNQIQYYERSYKKIVNILADIGGFANSILFIATIINKLVNKYITILDSQDLIIDIDKKLANNCYNHNIKIFHIQKSQSDFHTNCIYNEISDNKKSCKIVRRNIINNLGDNIINNNERNYYAQSIGTKNLLLANNLLNNNNLLIKVINQKKELNQNSYSVLNNKINIINKEYKFIEKMAFSFCEYLLYFFCNKKNKILGYEDFRQKIVSEEQFIESYIKLFKLLNIISNNNDKNKYNNIDMTIIMDSINKGNI